MDEVEELGELKALPKENFIETAIEAGKDIHNVSILNKTILDEGVDIPDHVLIWREYGEVKFKSLEEYHKRPLQKSGEKVFREVKSFNSYVLKHFVDGETVISADRAEAIFNCVFDDHSKIEPGRGNFMASLVLSFSDQWESWSGKNKEYFSQSDFAEFLEDNRVDFMAMDDGENKNLSAVELIGLVEQLQSTRKCSFSSKINRVDGSVQFAFQNGEKSEKGNISIPERMTLAIPVYDGGDIFAVEIRLRHRINTESGGLKFFYVIDQMERIEKKAFDKMRDRVSNGSNGSTEDLVYPGTGIEVLI
jgi:uncharacterized protein YfdQ (DUF2303 family)